MNLTKVAESILRTVAPTAATYLGTPLAGMAVKAVLDKFLGPEEAAKASPAKVEAVLTSMTPVQALELQKADQAFQKDMASLTVNMEQIASADRASARTREVNAKDSWTPRVLAGMSVLAYSACASFVFMVPVPQDMQVIAGSVLGTLSGAMMVVFNYYFGSTAGSATKTALIAAGPGAHKE